MKRKNLLLTLFLVLALSLSLFAVACDTNKPEETTKNEGTSNTESGSVKPQESESSETESKSEPTSESGSDPTSESESDPTSESESDPVSESESEPISETDSETEPATRPVVNTPVDELGCPVDPDEETEAESETKKDPNAGRCHPRYAADDEYHWSPACDVCGKNAGTPKIHSIICDVEDEGDLLLYTYYCGVCDYVIKSIEVPFNLNLYISPEDLLEVSHNFGTDPKKFVFLSTNDGAPSAEYISEKGMGSSITLFSDDANAIATGKYLVMKIKLNNGRVSFKLDVSTVDAYRKVSQTTKQATVSAVVDGLSSGWSTVIIDLSKLTSGDLGYIPSSTGDYYLHQLKITLDGSSSVAQGESVKIAYAAFCNSEKEAREFAKDEYCRYIYRDLLSSAQPDSKDGTPCNHKYTWVANGAQHNSDPCPICKDNGGAVDHKYSYTANYADNGMLLGYSLKCVCGKGVTPDWTFAEGSVLNYYSGPGQMSTNWASVSSIKTEGDMVFTRLVFTNGSASCKFDNGSNTSYVNKNDGGAMREGFDTLVGGSGRYIVFKFRLSNAKKMSHLALGAYAQGAALPYNEGQVLGKPNFRHIVNTPEGWNVMVIDTSTFDSNYYPSNDPNVAAATFGLKLSGSKDEYIDVAYFAVVNNWDGVMTLLADENLTTVKFSPEWDQTASDVERAFDGSCIGNAHVIATKHEDVVWPDEVNKDVCFTCNVIRYCTGEKCGIIESEAPNTVIKHNIVSQEGGDNRKYPDTTVNDYCYTYSKEDYCTVCDKVVDNSEGAVGHSMKLPEDRGDKYVYICSDPKCAHSISIEYGAEGVNFNSMPGQIVNLWGTTQTAGGTSLQGAKTKLTNIIADADGIYTRIHIKDNMPTVYVANGTVADSNHWEYSMHTADNAEEFAGTGADVSTDLLTGGCGKYAVLKIRVNNVGSVKFGVTTDKVTETVTIPKYLDARDTNDGMSEEFITYVVDISSLANDEAEKVRVILRGDDTSKSGAYIDVAYMAICEDWAAIANVIGSDDVVSLQAWGNDAGTAYTNAEVQQMASGEAQQ